ncbi:T-cell immunoglobulin and mucin domain-containing protein 4-like isoform X3 [Arvicanthis niloticus]|uniref:T-cell immunoglobulin and mucin domain-containing protein 4-like isoform X3 n=1 Tax=Arvicanthis niloticus TaxID=61156 RepID=UPI00402B6A9A
MSKGLLLLWLVMELWWLYLTPAASEDTVIGFLGQSVTLPCHYSSWSQSRNSMCWGKGTCPKSKCNAELLHTDGTRAISRKSRKYTLKGNIQFGDVSLTIENTNQGDSGVYCCRIEVPGWFNDVKKTVRLELRRESETLSASKLSQRSMMTISTDIALFRPTGSKAWLRPSTSQLAIQKITSVTKATPKTARTHQQINNKQTSSLIIACCVGFVVMVLLFLAFLLRGKVTEANCLQRHKRPDNTEDSKSVLNDMSHGREDEDGLFTL